MPISLAGPWMLHDAAGIQIGPCPIPGDVHSALIAAGRIADPMIGRNEAEVQWVGEATWELRRRFSLDGAEIAGKWAVLDLEFVDTVADVIVNGFDVARVFSSFIRHRLDVSDVIRAGENDIVLRFASAEKEAHALAARQPFPIPWSVSNNRVADMNMIRKAQCHAGWDWGLCLMVIDGFFGVNHRFLCRGERLSQTGLALDIELINDAGQQGFHFVQLLQGFLRFHRLSLPVIHQPCQHCPLSHIGALVWRGPLGQRPPFTIASSSNTAWLITLRRSDVNTIWIFPSRVWIA